jgi:hypothetical protein
LFIRIIKYDVKQKLWNGNKITWTSDAGFLFTSKPVNLALESHVNVDTAQKMDKKKQSMASYN